MEGQEDLVEVNRLSLEDLLPLGAWDVLGRVAGNMDVKLAAFDIVVVKFEESDSFGATGV